MSEVRLDRFTCVQCNDKLFAPVFSLKECTHHVHEFCVKKIRKTNLCPSCQIPISKTEENQEFNKRIKRITELEHSALKNFSPERGLQVALHQAIEEDDLDTVSYLISEENALISTPVQGLFPLFRACLKGKEIIAKFLLEQKANPNQQNDLSSKGKYDNYWYVNDFDHFHCSRPIDAAIKYGKMDLVHLIIQYKGEIDQPNGEGQVPTFRAIAYGKEDIALFFLEKEIDINREDNNQISLMSLAIRHGQLKVVQKLHEKGVNLLKVKENNYTFLHDASGYCRIKNPQVLEYLLKNGGDRIINQRWFEKITPLSVAVTRPNVEAVKLLVQAGADLSIKYGKYNILEVAEQELHETQSYYKDVKDSESKEEGEKAIKSREEIITFLKQAMKVAY